MAREGEEVASSHSSLGVIVEQGEQALVPLKYGEFEVVVPEELTKAQVLAMGL